MTCIAATVSADGTITMGGDSAGVAGYFLVKRDDPKVFIKDKMIFGYTTSFRMGQLIRFKLSIPLHDPKKETYEYMCTDFIEAVRKCFETGGFMKTKESVDEGGNFLVGYKGELFEVESDFQVGKWAFPYAAVGCGAQIALGAMYATVSDDHRAMVEHALQGAETFNAGVRGPFTILELKPE